MTEYEKAMLRSQIFMTYFKKSPDEACAFTCLCCGSVSRVYEKTTKKKGEAIKHLLPRRHNKDCPVAAKIKELEL